MFDVSTATIWPSQVRVASIVGRAGRAGSPGSPGSHGAQARSLRTGQQQTDDKDVVLCTLSWRSGAWASWPRAAWRGLCGVQVTVQSDCWAVFHMLLGPRPRGSVWEYHADCCNDVLLLEESGAKRDCDGVVALLLCDLTSTRRRKHVEIGNGQPGKFARQRSVCPFEAGHDGRHGRR